MCNPQKDSFHSNFSLVLKRVFSKFYPEMVIDYVEELASFCKEWLLGIGCAVSGQFDKQILPNLIIANKKAQITEDQIQ